MINLTGYRVKILCEDNSHFYFLQGVFEALNANVSDRECPFKKIPCGKGCGAQTVMDGFKELVGLACKNRENIVFAAIIDADSQSFEQRRQALYDTIDRNMREQIDNMNNFIISIPRRNIETWLEFCRRTQAGETTELDEITNYKHRDMRIKHKQAGKWLIGELRQGKLNFVALDSLARFCQQFN